MNKTLTAGFMTGGTLFNNPRTPQRNTKVEMVFGELALSVALQ
jgi:hypothetical protein